MDNSIHKKIGARIKTIRKAKKITREKLSELSDLSYDFLGRVERGDRSLSIESLFKIADGLKTDVDEIVNISPKKAGAQKGRINIEALNLLQDADDKIRELEKIIRDCKTAMDE